jgi:predicted transcriptional regulator
MEREMAKIELSDPVPVRLPVDVLADIEKVAAATDRTRSWVMVRALKLYLAGEGADILAILRGREEAAQGGGHDADDVIAELDEIIRSKVA